MLPPVETSSVETDEDMNRLIAGVRDSIAAELETEVSSTDYTDSIKQSV